MVQGGLVEAVQKGNLSRALQLLSDGLDVNEQDQIYGWTSLHVAARDNKVGLAKVLIRHGANVNQRDKVGQTPLHRAAFWGHMDIIRLLVDSGADFTALDDLLQTPEELARIHGHPDCSGILIQCCVFLEFGGLHDYSPHQIEQMKRQMREKVREEKRRRELREELTRSGEVADKLREKMRAKEAKLLEKQDIIQDKIDLLRGELSQITARAEVGTLNKRELINLRDLQEKLHKLQNKLEEHRLKISSAQRRTLKSVDLDQKGAAWIAFINS